MEPEDDIEQIIVAAIEQHVRVDPARLARMIVEGLWEAGYDVIRRPDDGRNTDMVQKGI